MTLCLNFSSRQTGWKSWRRAVEVKAVELTAVEMRAVEMRAVE